MIDLLILGFLRVHTIPSLVRYAARLGHLQRVLGDLSLLFLADTIPVAGNMLVAKKRSHLFEGGSFSLGIQEPNDRGFDCKPHNIDDIEPGIWLAITLVPLRL